MTEESAAQEQQPAKARYFNEWDGEYELVLHCGGDDDDDHMTPMVMNWEAATPHGVCPICGNQAYLGNWKEDDD